MACNPNRSQCSPDGVFAAVASAQCSQFFNPANFSAEQLIYDSAFKDLINSYGIPVDYYINTFNVETADNLYGEQPTAIFYGPISIQMFVELNENAISLSKYGFASDDELTGYIHIDTFNQTVCSHDFYVRSSNGDIMTYDEYVTYIQTLTSTDGVNFNIDTLIPETGGYDFINGELGLADKFFSNNQVIEPKSGDLIQISPLGCDRPNGRGAKVFEVTERTDEDVAQINPLLGHYVYRLKGKRYEYSFEPGAPIEKENQQVFENSFSGILSSNIPGVSASPDKSYSEDIVNISKTQVLDMSVNDTDIYGLYY